MAMVRRFTNGLPLLAALVLSVLAGGRAQSMRGARGTSHGRLWFRAAGQMQVKDLELALGVELADHGERMARLEDGLRTLFTALPKTEQGRLGHEAVRHALRRFFLKLNGWFIRGLEPGNRTWTPERGSASSIGFFKEWVPSHLQELLEARVGEAGADLHDVAALAAALEDLMKQEAAARLSMVYEAHDLKPEQALTRSEATDVLMSYFYSFSVAHNITVHSYSELASGRQWYLQNNAKEKEWFQDLMDRHFGREHHLGDGKLHDFKEAVGVVDDLSQNFHTLNELECKDLKAVLSGLVGRKPGRVRLSSFYNATQYSHWVFSEGREYLRSLGALDDTDPQNPSVVIPNYAMARNNCLDASHLFTVCCRNPCESMMGHLEAELASDRAEPHQIAALISKLPSESVKAPQTLPQSLLSRLNEIAVHHGGKVPIHGWLFAQWMHHAYPMECPYPHEQGLNPQTALEWMSDTGASAHASQEEIQMTVESDHCAIDWQGKPECMEESTELPWSTKEELLISSVGSRSTRVQMPLSGVWRVLSPLLDGLSLALPSLPWSAS